MNFLKSVFTLAGLASVSLCANNVDNLIKDLSSNDYELRHQSLLELKSILADVSVNKADSVARHAFEKELINSILNDKEPIQTKVYLIRLLGLIGEEASLQQLEKIAISENVDQLVKENAIKAISAIPSQTATDTILKGLKNAAVDEKNLWWTALGYQADSSVDTRIVDLIHSENLELTPEAIHTLGQVGSEKTSILLSKQLESSDAEKVIKLEQALLNTNASSSKTLGKLLENGSNEAIKVAAFKSLVIVDPSKAKKAFKKMIDDESVENKSLFIDAALETDESYWSYVIDSMDFLDLNDVKTVFACIADAEKIEYESKVVQWLTNEEATTAALKCLSEIGGSASSSAIIDHLQSKDKEIKETAIYALSRIEDESLDNRMSELAKQTNDPAHLSAIQILAIRNSNGAIEQINEFIHNGAKDDTLKELLAAVELIGNIDSCKVLIGKITNESDKSLRKKYQVTLKRLSAKLMLPDILWDQVYQPALKLSSQNVQKISIIEVLDSISNQGALDYCLSELKTNQDTKVQKSINGVLNRWRNLNISNYWLDIILKSDSEKEIKSAIRSVSRLIKADYVNASQGHRASVAANLFIKSESSELRNELLTIVETFSQWTRSGFVNSLSPMLEIGEYEKQIRKLTDKSKYDVF